MTGLIPKVMTGLIPSPARKPSLTIGGPPIKRKSATPRAESLRPVPYMPRRLSRYSHGGTKMPAQIPAPVASASTSAAT